MRPDQHYGAMLAAADLITEHTGESWLPVRQASQASPAKGPRKRSRGLPRNGCSSNIFQDGMPGDRWCDPAQIERLTNGCASGNEFSEQSGSDCARRHRPKAGSSSPLAGRLRVAQFTMWCIPATARSRPPPPARSTRSFQPLRTATKSMARGTRAPARVISPALRRSTYLELCRLR